MNERQHERSAAPDNETPRNTGSAAPKTANGAEQARTRERDTEATTHPHIYIASLGDYVNGSLHGEWLDATQSTRVLEDQIRDMLSRSPYMAATGEPVEEWAIHDSDGFGNIRIEEYTSLTTVTKHARAIQQHGLAYAAWFDMNGIDREDKFEDEYLGEYDSLEAYVESLVDESGWESILDQALPSYLRSYVKIDTDQLARDMHCGGDVYTVDRPDGGVWVFRG